MAWLLVVTGASALNKSHSVGSEKTVTNTPCTVLCEMEQHKLGLQETHLACTWLARSGQTTGLHSAIQEKSHYQRVFKQERLIKHQELNLVPKLSDKQSQTTSSVHCWHSWVVCMKKIAICTICCYTCWKKRVCIYKVTAIESI